MKPDYIKAYNRLNLTGVFIKKCMGTFVCKN